MVRPPHGAAGFLSAASSVNRTFTDTKGSTHQVVELIAADFQVLARKQEVN